VPSPKRKRRPKNPRWATCSDEELLDLTFAELGVSIEGTWLEAMTTRLEEELAAKGIRHRPHYWLSNEWFSPDGVPGIAIPFYLAHKRLMLLERRQVLEVEGGTQATCMRILRHEMGHVIDTAHGLRRRASWRKHFGRVGTTYPDSYRPKPHSRRFVHHLDGWYAQSHPVEDFAETFAVWMTPRSRWRTRYEGWPALQKLVYVDDVMEEVGGRAARHRSKRLVDPIHRMQRTLREHYAQKRGRYGVDFSDFYDLHLRHLFVEGHHRSAGERAGVFLRRAAPELRRVVSQWTGYHPYTVDQFLREMIVRSRARDLWVPGDTESVRMDIAVLLTVQVMRALAKGGYRVSL